MAWRCSASTHVGLIDNLRKTNVITSLRVYEVLKAVDRGFFSPTHPYQDAPQAIGRDATISAPHVHAIALEVLEPRLAPGCNALDVGSGSGYLVACFANMVVGENEGSVLGIEYNRELVETSIANLTAYNPEIFRTGRVKVIVGNGWDGSGDGTTFDAIHVGASVERIPQSLVNQLRPGGLMVAPVGPQYGSQELQLVKKLVTGEVEVASLMGVRYVPLVNSDYIN